MNLRYISCTWRRALRRGEMGKRQEPPASRAPRQARGNLRVQRGRDYGAKIKNGAIAPTQ